MRRSWLMVLMCGSLIIACSMRVRQVSGLFLRPVAMDLALSREAFGFAVALQNLVWGLTQPIAGFLADRYGTRPVAFGGVLFYAAGLALAAFASNGWQFVIGLGVLAGLGQSGTAFAVILAVIGRAAPVQTRSLALGLGSTASSIGMFILVPATVSLIDIVDWRATMLILCGLLAATAGFTLPLQEGAGGGAVTGASAKRAIVEAIGDRDFWLLNVGFAVCGFQLAFIATYIPTILIDGGLDVSAGAAVLVAIGIFNIGGTYLAGLAGGWWRKTRVLAGLYLARAVVIVEFL